MQDADTSSSSILSRTTESIRSASRSTGELAGRLTPLQWGLIAAIAGVFSFYVFGLHRFTGMADTTAAWLRRSWNDENGGNWSHGWLLPPVMLALAWRALPAAKAQPAKPSNMGISWILLGCLLFVAGFWTMQARLSVFAIPFILAGIIHFLWGWKVTQVFIFPLSIIFFMVPMPGLQQATNKLQIVTVAGADVLCHLTGADTVRSGTKLTFGGNNWDVDEGCSGIRSLIALTLVTYIYGMLMHKSWRDRLIIFAMCIPIAMVANMFRIFSIVQVGRVDQKFASGAWHDSSGFLSFAVALLLLMLISKILNEGLRSLRPKVKVTRVAKP